MKMKRYEKLIVWQKARFLARRAESLAYLQVDIEVFLLSDEVGKLPNGLSRSLATNH